MALIARIIGLFLLTAGLGRGYVLFGNTPDWSGISLLLACVGAVVGCLQEPRTKP